MTNKLFPFCVYTTAARETLSEIAEGGGEGELDESKPWKGARKLLQKARADKLQLPILFSDAAHDCSSLFFWAILEKIEIDEGKKGTREDKATKFSFKSLKKIRGRKTQDLTLRSTGQKISPGFIWPYAICNTPDFLLK